jgi:hypothetical protein
MELAPRLRTSERDGELLTSNFVGGAPRMEQLIVLNVPPEYPTARNVLLEAGMDLPNPAVSGGT